MNDLFRLPGARRRDPAVDPWLAAQAPALGALAHRWFARMRTCGRDVRETMHDGCPTACVQNAAFGYVGVFTAHVNIGFFHGADLEDPGSLLQGSGRRMRHVKLKPGVDVDARALEALIRAAYADITRRLAAEADAQAATKQAKTRAGLVDEYLAEQPAQTRRVLQRVRKIIRHVLPDAEETISYRIPACKVAGRPVVYFAGWKEHWSLYPVTEPVRQALGADLGPYQLSKGTVRFPLADPVPVRLVERIVRELAGAARRRGVRRSRR